MSTHDAILSCKPTSYWPLDDGASATTVRDEKGLNPGTVAESGVQLAAVRFGSALMPLFDGALGSLITIPHDDCYSHTFANALTVLCWICPSSLNFTHTSGSTDQFVHFIEKGEPTVRNVEWAMRQYNVDSSKPSRLSFYLFNSGPSPGKGAGAYMQHRLSANDKTPVEIGRWLFLVGQGECWIDERDTSTGANFYKQAQPAACTPGDKYNNPPSWNVRPHNGRGPITIGGSIRKTAFHGSVAHVALWNRLLTGGEIEHIWSAGVADLA